MIRLLSLFVLVGLTGIWLIGCGNASDEPLPPPENADVHEDVRAEFQGVVGGGRSVIVYHEPIPDVMGAMTMTLPVSRPGVADTFAPGTPVVFDLHIGETTMQIRNLQTLPDTTTLDLPDEPPEDQAHDEAHDEAMD